MSYKKKIYKYIISSIIIVLIGYVLVDLISFEFSSCGFGYNGPTVSESGETIFTPSCGDIRGYLEDADENIGMPLMIFFIPIIALLFIFLFVREEIFNAWFEFSKKFIPAMVIIATLIPDYDDMFFHSNQVSRSIVWSVLFISLSLLYVALKSLRTGEKFWKFIKKPLTVGIGIILVEWIILSLGDM